MRGILITGAARRIGAALAEFFAARGWHVFVHYGGSARAAEQLTERIHRDGGVATPVQADLIDHEASLELLRRCNQQTPLVGLINNASLFQYDTPMRLAPDIWSPLFQVNLRTPAHLATGLFELLKTGGRRGVTINILDNKLSAMNPDYYTYTLTKAGLQTATEAMAMAFGGVMRCAGIAPGITLSSPLQNEDDFTKVHDANPLRRGCRTADICAAAGFIAETESFSGQVLTIDGGLHLAGPARDIVFSQGAPESDQT